MPADARDAKETYTISLEDILPTQLYISETKYQHWSSYLRNNSIEGYPPVPVKRIGHDLFFTDGHTRAYALWERGVREITVCNDTDDMDWVMYLVDLKWCREAGICSIADLADRKVNDGEYRKLWLDRCTESHDRIQENPIRDLKIGFETDPERKSAIADEVLRSLPKWFGIEAAIVDYVEHVRELDFVAATMYGKVVGFCAVKVNFDRNADLYVLGLFGEFHRLGIGTRMIDFIEDHCRKNGIRFMSVKTLSSRHPDVSYAKTRSFYEHCGFRAFEELPTLWGDANPCLYMIKDTLAPDRQRLRSEK